MARLHECYVAVTEAILHKTFGLELFTLALPGFDRELVRVISSNVRGHHIPTLPAGVDSYRGKLGVTTGC